MFAYLQDKVFSSILFLYLNYKVVLLISKLQNRITKLIKVSIAYF